MSQEYPIGTPSFVSPYWAQEYCNGDLCEWTQEYSSGNSGLCPVLIGDIIGGEDMEKKEDCSFEVVGKLGHGSYSTVWLVQDRKTSDYLALKILRVEHSTPENVERRILRDTGRLVFSFLYTHQPTLRRHLCLIMRPTGCSLRDRLEAGYPSLDFGCPWDVISISIIVHALVSKVFDLHRKGIYHGDLSPSNATLGLAENAFSPESLEKTFGEDTQGRVFLAGWPHSVAQPPVPGYLPKYIVQHSIPLASDESALELVDIIDFGQGGYTTTEKKKKLRGTTHYQAPEKTQENSVAGIRADLWSLGCLVFFAIAHRHLFGSEEEEHDYLVLNETQRVSFIETQLRKCFDFTEHPKYRGILSRLIHSLLRVNPIKRHAPRTQKLLDQLIEYTAPLYAQFEQGE